MDYIIYSQSTGEIKTQDGKLLGTGWAGNDNTPGVKGKNNPDAQNIKATGPLPRGWYNIGVPLDNPTVGPFSMRLTPDSDNEMFGRDNFLIHGAAKDREKYGKESKGCIVAVRPTREKIYAGGYKRLWVVE